LDGSFVDTDVCPTLLGPDKNDIGLLDFVKSVDSFKVKVREITLVEGEVPLLTKTTYMVVVPSTHTIHLVNHTIVDELKEHTGKKKRNVRFSAGPPPTKRARAGSVVISEPNPTTAGKSPVVIQKLIAQSVQPNFSFGSATHHAKEFVSFSVTPTSKSECQDESDSTQGGNVRTRRASKCYVVLSSSPDPLDKDLNTSSKVGSPNPHVHIEVENMAVGPVNGTEDPSILKNDTGATSLPGNGTGTSSLPRDETIDSTIAQDINVLHWDVTNDAQLDDLVMCRNLIDHVPPPAKVEKAESEADEVIELHRRVSLEAVVVAKKSLHSELDARIAELNHDMDNELCPHMLTVVVGQRWEGLKAGIEHGKAGRSLAEVTTYDPGVGAGCVTVVNELDDDSFPLLEHLRDSNSISHEILLSDALATSHHRVRRGKWARLLDQRLANLVVLSQDTSFVVADYQI
nr:hypothetical protein [Tanacetum cinerariifolium]